jgi:hypothetical protein
VLELRFGLVGDRPHTLEEVGQKFELTRERIRQIEAKALSKLRHPAVPPDGEGVDDDESLIGRLASGAAPSSRPLRRNSG